MYSYSLHSIPQHLTFSINKFLRRFQIIWLEQNWVDLSFFYFIVDKYLFNLHNYKLWFMRIESPEYYLVDCQIKIISLIFTFCLLIDQHLFTLLESLWQQVQYIEWLDFWFDPLTSLASHVLSI